MLNATASGPGDPFAEPGTRPDEAWRSHEDHWLQFSRGGDLLAARWVCSAWTLDGEEGVSSPVEVSMRGYKWAGPRFNHPSKRDSDRTL